MSTTIAPSTTATAVIATVEALTTEFVAPAPCYSMQLTMLSSPKYEIWLNEPQPVPGTKVLSCYPTEWASGYTSIFNSTSSIVPMMSPLVAPENWVTAQEMDNGYIALCPSGFQIHLPDSPIDTNRPAYGATCYSTFDDDATLVMSGYDSSKYTGTVTFVAKSTDQAYAHVIEGKKASSTASSTGAGTAGTSTAAPSSDAASTGSLTSSDSSTSSSGVSGGAIAGAVVGSIAGVALIALAAFFLFRRRRTQQTGSAAQTGHSNPEMGDGYQSVNGHQGHSAYPDNNAYHTADKALPLIPPEGADIVSPTSYHDGAVPPYQSYELPTNHTYEMESPQGTHPQARELDAGYMGNELHNAGTNHAQRV